MIHLGMLLQEKRAKTKVQEGMIFHFPHYLFMWSGDDFPFHDDNKGRKKKRSRRRKRRYNALVMMVRFFTCPKTFLLLFVILFACFMA